MTVKNTEKGREEMCTLVEDYAKEYAKEYAKDTVKEVARKLLRKGMNVTDVIESTGLSQEDVLEIKEKADL